MCENFSNILVVDLEATCSSDYSILPESMEIIEIGAVWVSLQGEFIGQFQRYVRPILNPVLTPFCRDLTGIEQYEIDRASIWSEVAVDFGRFVAQFNSSRSYWGSWGNYDKKQVERECDRHQVENPLLDIPHENLKSSFAKNRKIKQVGMATALKIVGLSMKGEHHRAISDAFNIVQLLPACHRFNK
jgi:inhibitor of KinA sporulation pathway (predicted exonuclease)